MQLVIIAGGKGTRLKQMTADLPKSMVDVGGKPLLEHQILLARQHGILDILILTGYGSEHIEQYFGDGSAWGVRIRCHQDEQPLGTAGALFGAFEKLEDIFLVMYGDTMLNVDLTRMLAFHSDQASATLFVHPNDHPQDSDLVELDDSGEVIALQPYPHAPDSYHRNLVNAALYVFSRESLRISLDRWRKNIQPFDICKHLFPSLLADGAVLRGYISREYIKDAGTPERLQNVRRDYETGRVQASSFAESMPAVFLDRDGTVNYDHGWISAPDKIALLSGAAEAIRAIHDSGRLAVIITNQPVIARGECDEPTLRRIHNKLEWLLGEEHAYVDAIYYCPHHPDSGFPGERADLKVSCTCRKPSPGLLQRAARDLNIDVSRSWMIGDSRRDVETAANFGIPAVLVRSNQDAFDDLEDEEPRLRARTALDAVNCILGKAPTYSAQSTH
jgi:D,D-heptose 1,7-bisphosphate phosphatase